MSILSSNQIAEECQWIASQYPAITQLRLEGNSEDKRPIYSITIGTGEKTLLCTAGVHGRESINPTVLVNMTKNYCEAYTKDLQSLYREILSQYRIQFLPLLNPDGYEIALHGFDVIQNKKNKKRILTRYSSISFSEWKYNARGVDLNRNFSCQSYRKQQKYDQPFSEAESRILMQIFRREDSIGYIDFHSRGKEIFWYRAALNKAYNERQQKIAKALGEVCPYRIGTPEDEMLDNYSGGNTVQYFSEQYALPAITIETVSEEAAFPLASHWIEITYKEIFKIPLYYLAFINSKK